MGGHDGHLRSRPAPSPEAVRPPPAARRAGPGGTGQGMLASQAVAGNQAVTGLVGGHGTGAGTEALAKLTLPPGDGLAAARTVMAAIEGLSMGPDSLMRTTYRGEVITLTPEQAERVRASARTALTLALNRSARRSEDAMGRYRAQEEVNSDFPVTSHAVKAWAYVRTWGGYDHPGTALEALRFTLTAESAAARHAITAGAFTEAAGHLAKADAASERSAMLVRAYVDQLIEGGESLATGLEYTRDAAFVTLGVLAVLVSGGAALGLAPEVIGTGVAGLSVSGTATAISVGAPIAATVGVGAVKAAYGEKVDWGAIAVEAAVQVVLARVGGRVSHTIFGRLAGNPAAQTLARKAFASIAAGVTTHELSQGFSVAVHQTVDALRGRDVTWAGFADQLEQRLTDPKGLFMAALMSAVPLGASIAVDRAARPSTPTSTSASGPASAPGSAPARSPAPAGGPAPKTQPTPATPTPAPKTASPAPTSTTSKPPTETAPTSVTPKSPAETAPATGTPKPTAKTSEPAPTGTTATPPKATTTQPKATTAPPKATTTQPKATTARPEATATRRSTPAPEGPLGARRPGSRSRFAEGEGAAEAMKSADRGASLEERALESGGMRRDATPGRTPGRRSDSGAAAKTAKPAENETLPISERVLVGDLENGLPTGVTGELVPADLHTGSPSSSDVNPIGLRTGELDPLGARRGHLLGNLFGGSGRDRGNLAWMHEKINNSDYKVQFENPLRRALESGQSVRFGVRPKYRGHELAPYAVEVWATTTGGQVVVPVRNIATPGLRDITRTQSD
ncbi:DNA/RNA non-specific endonuclease [Sphaerisporangium perillae]|uniref:DNA/RNA non-specific endonuclease n=1 Tax=Sphaerisporangium perillae TaxID=2935860 RepID=UPI00200C20F1|nr:DNA/RNA non-specific endonuclease [Sphaerisporangium perillae]